MAETVENGTSAHRLDTPIEYLKGVGPKRGEVLRADAGIAIFQDLLLYFPFRYVDRTQVLRTTEVRPGMQHAQLEGVLKNLKEVTGGKKRFLTALLDDGQGAVELVWFRGVSYWQNKLVMGQRYRIFGRPEQYKGRLKMAHPEISPADSVEAPQRMEPMYQSTERMKKMGLDSRGLARIQQNLHELHLHQVPENLPVTLLQQYRLPGRVDAFAHIHFPPDEQALKMARNRLKFEELFFTQLSLVRQKMARNAKIRGYVFAKVGAAFNRFYQEILPFTLTGAQKRVLREIRHDVRSGHQMNRLLQGDVGSGKTIVGAMSMLLAHDNGYQAAMMAPTEILATQHYQSLCELLEPVGLRVSLLTGSTKKKARTQLHQALQQGHLHVLVGTHALLEDVVQFQNLGLVVIDEQHRFGVAQRARMYAKNQLPPHILVMTATPIPRTLAMTVYGDLDVSVIDELPPGRKPIETRHVIEAQRPKVFGFMKKQIQAGQQVYMVYPLIEESKEMDYNNLMEGYVAVQKEFPPPHYQISIVHGRMRPEDKEFEMQRFKKKETQIMVATTVIEVGVDVPNASIMLIENAERFGLSQLHQLRGRVGRGAAQSYCILLTNNKLGKDAKTRMETMVRTNDGFEVAEVDMNLRGPGDLNGTQQSGMVDFKLANLATDQQHLTAARRAVEDLLKRDPDLQEPEHQPVRAYVATLEKNEARWSLIS